MPSRSVEFAAYVPGLVLRRARRGLPPPPDGEGDRVPAVALFADVAGSTKLANQLARLGRLVGPEEMSRILNAYYEPLVSLLRARGGDVIGFAGDAVLAVWPAAEAGLRPAARQAAQAALEVQRDLNNLELAPGVRLSLRICLGAGDLSTALVGGKQGFWQLVGWGPPLDQIREAGKLAEVGKVYLSKEARAHLDAGAEVEPLPGGGAFVRRLAAVPPLPAADSLDPQALPEEAFRPYVPRAVQESLDAGLGEFLDQSRTVSVLFVRVHRPPGITPTWERVQRAMTVFQEAMARYEGTVLQLIEDDKGLVAVLAFGLPAAAHEDDAALAVEAAAYLRDRAREREVQCGVGVGTGVPFCGPLGSAARRMYAVVGADVIRAARLMELAAPGEILCDDPTREAARQRKGMDHRFVPLPRYRLKGFEAPVRVYRVDPARTPAGREREWEQLLGVLDDTIDGNGRVVWVEGEPGAGAADLVAGLAEQAAGRTRRLGRPRQSPDEPPPPWPAVWADLLSVRSVTDPVLRREQVEAFFAALPESAPHPSLWNHLLDITIPEPPAVAAMNPADRDAARRGLLLDLIDEMAARKPVLVVLEDAHRFDAAGWETARAIAGRVGRVTLVLTAEPVADPPAAWRELRDAPGTLRLVLRPLDPDATDRVARDRLGAKRLGERLTALVRERGQGNPARVVQECERLLAEDGLVTADGVCELADGPAAGKPATRSRFDGPLIGRAAEREVLARSLDAVWTGESRVLLVEGDSGLGKSRLVEELRGLAADRAMLTFAGYCSAVESATPYHPWRDVFTDLLGLAGLPDPAEREAWVLGVLRRRPELLRFAPLLNDLLGLRLPEDEVVRQLTGQTRADNLHDVLTGLLDATADGRPTLLLLEDAHWADSASWRLAGLVRERVGRVVVVLTVRHVGSPPPEYERFTAATWADRIPLGLLTEADSREFARVRLGAERVADPLARLVWERAHGNPLYIEQVVDHLAAAELVEVRDGTAALAAGAAGAVDSAVPDTIRGLIVSRLDRLPPAHQLTAKVSSVIGPLFPARALAGVYPDPAAVPALREHIRALVRERLIREDRPEPDPVYDFPHPVLQQVCYELLPRPQRQRLHQSAAAWYQAEGAAGSAQYRLIAHHWGRAGVADRQAECLALAGESALRDGAYREAVTGFAELLRLSEERFGPAPPPDEAARRAHWEYQLGEAYFGLGDLPASAEHLRRALAGRGRPGRTSTAGLVLQTLGQVVVQLGRRLLPRRRRPPAGREEALESAAALARLAQIHYFANEVLPGVNETVRALNLSESAGPSPELARSYATMTVLCGILRWQSPARLYDRLAESVAREVGHLPTLAGVLTYLGVYELGQGGWDRVEALGTEAVSVAERLGDLRQTTEAATVLGMLECFRGNYAAGERWYERVTETARRTGNTMHVAWGLNGSGECLFRLGRWDEAVARLREAGQALEGNRDRNEQVRVEGMLAALALRAGDAAAAEAHAAAAERTAALGSKTTCSTLEGFAGVAEVRFAAAEADPDSTAARRAASVALAALRRHAKLFPVGGPRAKLFEGRLHDLAGARGRAERAWRAGIALAERRRMPFDAALLHHRLGSPARREHLEAAARLYERLGIRNELEQVRAELAAGS